MRRGWFGLFVLGAVLAAACAPGRKDARGFRLPDGDPHRGEAAFVSLGCADCHQVAGADLPAAAARAATPVVLGGQTTRPRTDGELVTAIVYPSYTLAAAYPREEVTLAGFSRMPEYGPRMSVRDLEDVVAFLQSHYVVVRPPTPRIR